MKAIKLTSMLAAVLAITIAGTGCQKRPNGVTPINRRDSIVRSPDLTGFPPIDPNGGLVGNEIGGGAQPGGYEDLEKFNQDRDTFKANIVHFEYDSSVIKGSELAHVEAVASYIKSTPSVGVLVEGHCDERGTEDYNNALGERRATAIREALISSGADANRIVTRSFGEYKPAAQGQDESAYRQNRRGEFVVLHPK